MKQSFSFSRSFVRGELVLGFWSFAKKGAGALDSFFILSALSLYQFGVYQLLLSLYAILSDFFHDMFGEVITNDLSRCISEGREDKAKRLFFEYALFRFAMALIPCTALFFAAPFVSSHYGLDITVAIQMLSFLFIADVCVAVVALVLKLRLEFQILAPRATTQKIVQLAFLGAFYFFSQLGIKEIFIAQIAGALGAALFMAPAAVRSWGPWRGIAASREALFWKIARSYGKWALPQSFLTDFTGKVRPWLIQLFLTTEAVGMFGVANTFLSALKDLLPIRTVGLLLPRKTKDPAALARFYQYGTKYYMWFAVLLGVAAAGGVPAVIMLFFPKFAPSLPLFFVLLVTLPIFAFIKPMSFFLVTFRRQKFIFLQMAFQSALSFVLLLIFLPTIGILGLATAEIVSSGASAVARYWYLRRANVIPPFPLGSLLAIASEDREYFAQFRQHLRASLRPIFRVAQEAKM